jgi:GR25 family glycosyltransferase involved in LPS biosynthesis
MSYQFIVINACEKRKEKMIEIFQEMQISNDLVYYLEASMPENSQDYFIDTSYQNIKNNNTKNICCTKSHFRAIEYAAKDESPEYSIIVEDDVAFHKTDFFKIVDEIITNWDTNLNHCDYISLGWVPCNNYDFYKSKKHMKIQSISDINDKFCFLNDFWNVGLQCYIVKKNKIKNFVEILNKTSYNEFKKSIIQFMEKKYFIGFDKYSNDSADHIFNRMMTYEIIFPPLAIEQNNISSLLGHNNSEDYWHKFFNSHEEEIKNYMTY